MTAPRAMPDAQHVVVIGGFGRSLVNFRLDLMKRMRGNGHRVTAIAPELDLASQKALEAEDIDWHLVPLQRTGLNPVADLRTLFALYRFLRAARPDTVLAYTMKPIVYGCLAARLAGVSRSFALFTGLGYAFIEAQPAGRRRLVRDAAVILHKIALRRITGAFCYNSAERRDIRRFGLIPVGTPLIDVNGTGVDTSHFAPTPAPVRPVRFLFVGRLLRSKGLEVLADAARRLRQAGAAFELEILGPFDSNPDAIARDQVMAWAEEGLFTYAGATEDVRPYLARASVFVLPTMLREGVPRTILEAMAMARPVITTDAPGCGETIEDGVSGRVVPQGDAEALAGAMGRFIERPEEIGVMGDAARARVVARNDVHAINRRLLEAMGLEAGAAAPPASQSAGAPAQATAFRSLA